MGLAISEADIARSRADQRFKQVLLAKSLEQLLDMLYRLNHTDRLRPADAQSMREGAEMAAQLADLIHAIDERLSAQAARR